MARTVITPDGKIYGNVPDNYTDEQVFQMHLEAQQEGIIIGSVSVPSPKANLPEVEEEEEKEEPEIQVPEASIVEKPEEESGIATDIARGFTKFGSFVPKLATDVFGVPEGFESQEQFVGQTRKAFSELITDFIPGVEPEDIVTEEGKVKERGLTGTAVEAAPYLIGGSVVAGSKLIASLPAITRAATTVGSLGALNQLLYTGDANDTIFRSLEDSELLEANQAAQDFVEFMSIDKDDTVLEERIKLTVDNAVAGVAGYALFKGVVVGSKAAGKLKKPLEQLTKSEQAEAIMDALKETRSKIKKPKFLNSKIDYTDIDDDALQILEQTAFKSDGLAALATSGPLRRFFQQVFTSRGYWSPKAFSAFNDSQYAERQIVSQAEHISNRLQKALNSLNDGIKTKRATTLVQRALSEDLDFAPDMSLDQQIKFVSQKYKLNSDIATEVVNARNLIDDLSAKVLNSNVPSPDFKEAILDNMGMYIRRSYRLYEDAGYRPSSAVLQNARNYFREQAKKQGIKDLKDIEDFATNKIQSILDTKKGKALESYYGKVNKVNTQILKQRDDIPLAVRQLMGEIEQPSENIVLTVSKLSKLTENNRFFNELNELGTNKYIFTESTSTRGATVKISGTNSILDGKYTTPEILSAIQNKESHFSFLDSGLFRAGAQVKGFSQKMKTVYSHMTHLRNFLGGGQFPFANGINPFYGANQTRKLLWNEIKSGGDAALDTMYERYLRLGVINTNVRVNEFRSLLETGYQSNSDNFMSNLAKRFGGTVLPDRAYVKGAKIIDGIDDGLTDIYMATDDFFKINSFEKELAILKRAKPNEAIEVLEEEAANIVKNTMPNYDRVPKAIKEFRYLPFGNFVSFPAETLRTSAHIITQSAKELSSGNAELVKRGTARLAGFSASMAGWSALSDATYRWAGFDEEEQKAIQKLSETPWSSAPRNVARFGDTIYTNDTQFIDSYSTVKEPFAAAIREVESGELRGEELEKRLGLAIVKAGTNLLTPYFGEAIVTEAAQDLVYAFRGNGYTKEGRPVFVEGMSTVDQAAEAFYLMFDAFKPGSMDSIEKLADAAFEKPQTFTKKPRDLSAEMFTNATGIRFTEFDPQESFKFKVKKYTRFKRNLIIARPFGYVEKADNLVERYVRRQKALHDIQQDMYEDFLAAETLVGTDRALYIMQQNGISEEESSFIAQGIFREEDPLTDRKLMNDYEKLVFDDLPFEAYQNELYKAQIRMKHTPLMPVEPAELKEAFDRNKIQLPSMTMEGVENLPTEEEAIRGTFSKGGEVVVPNAPTEPDERIDKMTGQPYNIQAGSAFVDEEDPEKRMLFNEGGFVDNLKKAGYDAAAKALGVPKEGLEWAMNIDKKYPENEQLDGRGDAARHLALGVVAQKANYPETTRFLSNLREFIELDIKGGAMDIANNNKGFNIKADSYEDAERKIDKMIRNKEVLYYTPDESKSRRGYQAGGKAVDPSMYRSDGSIKSARGFLGPVKNNVEGGTMTEVSVGMKIDGQEMEVPTMVPTLTEKEIETLANMRIEGNAKNIPESIIIKAKTHALERMEQGLSPFYKDGEKN